MIGCHIVLIFVNTISGFKAGVARLDGLRAGRMAFASTRLDSVSLVGYPKIVTSFYLVAPSSFLVT